MSKFDGKSILVTGACGTIGADLVDQLLADAAYAPRSLVGIDNNESALFFLDQRYLGDPRAHFYVTDIRDRDALTELMRDVDIVFHADAFCRHMCRILAGTLLEVGVGKRSVQNFIEALHQKDRTRAGITAPPHGLTLLQVHYPQIESIPS